MKFSLSGGRRVVPRQKDGQAGKLDEDDSRF